MPNVFFLDMSNEILDLIVQNLPKPDILSLRLTSHRLYYISSRFLFLLIVEEIIHQSKPYLHTAILSCHSHALVSNLISAGAPLECPGVNSCTPLHTAARKKCMFSIKLFLHSGADVDAMDKFDWTALQLAARFGYEEVVEELVNWGADLNKKGFHGWTALHYAIREQHAEVERILRSRGAIDDAHQIRDGEIAMGKERVDWGQWTPCISSCFNEKKVH